MGGALRVEKAWGYELVWEVAPEYLGRIVHLNRGQRVWLESRGEPSRQLVICAGRMLLVFEDDRGRTCEVPLAPGQLHEIPVQTRHRMIAIEDSDLVVVSRGDVIDILRIED
jgi:mannose-6-phosphate isomerase